MDRRNASVPEGEVLQLRIGLHLGEVDRGGDLFGYGVNLSSRIEPLAPPGGICTSQLIYDQVWNKTDERLVYAGTQTLKGVLHPLKVYRVVRTVGREGAAFHSGTNPCRLAVLPLVNTSPDPGDAYLAEGMTEELIYALAGYPKLRVISHTSVLRYRGTAKSAAESGRSSRWGPSSEGTVRKVGDHLQITLQLVDPRTEEHRGAHAYDRALDDVFALQGEIATNVAQSLRPMLVEPPSPASRRRVTENKTAYTLWLEGPHPVESPNRGRPPSGDRLFRSGGRTRPPLRVGLRRARRFL